MRFRDLFFILHSPARAFASYDISITCANSDPGDKVNYFALQRYEDCAKEGFWNDPSIDGKARWDSSKSILMIEQKRYRPDEFDTSTWAENGEELCTFYDGKITNRSSCFDQKSKNCDNAVIPIKKGKFYYVTAVHTSVNGRVGDVFLFIHGYIRGDDALLQCGDDTWEAISPIVLPIISGIFGLISGLLLALIKKSVNCCYQISKPNQQNMTMIENEISGTLNARLLRDANEPRL